MPGCSRVTVDFGTGSGFQPAIVLACARALALSVTPGNSRRTYSSRQLALLLKDGADRSGLGFADNEHGAHMGGRSATGKQIYRSRPRQGV